MIYRHFSRYNILQRIKSRGALHFAHFHSLARGKNLFPFLLRYRARFALSFRGLAYTATNGFVVRFLRDRL